MSTFPVLLNPIPVKPRNSSQTLRARWIAALLGMVFVACTSNNLFGGSHTQVLVNIAWKWLFGVRHLQAAGQANLLLRKVGHYIGHGLLSLVFFRAWIASLVRRTNLTRVWRLSSAAVLGTLTTFVIASLDEWHQSFVPGRVGCFRDVLIDTAGALTANAIFLAVLLYRRRPARARQYPVMIGAEQRRARAVRLAA